MVKNIKIKASSLIDLIISMLLVSIVLTIAFTVFARLTTSHSKTLQLNALIAAEAACSTIRTQQLYINQTIPGEYFDIQVTCYPLGDLVDVEIMAISKKNKVLAQLKEYMFKASN